MMSIRCASILCLVCCIASVHQWAPHNDELHLFERGNRTIDEAFNIVYNHFGSSFDYKLYSHLMNEAHRSVRQSPLESISYASHPHCDASLADTSTNNLEQITSMVTYPGGSYGKLFGIDHSSLMTRSGKKVLVPEKMTKQGLDTALASAESLIGIILSVVPPKDKPLPCVPMVVGHNCFGSVLYPITLADFALAPTTDSIMDGVIASFPTAYARKVGKTSDAMYRSCHSSFMSLHCTSIFPRCTTPQSQSDSIPVGESVPACLHMCILPLIMCPGFWINDVIGQCALVSVPPLCTQAFYFKDPPAQLHTSDDSTSMMSRRCPRDEVETSLAPSAATQPASPILEKAFLHSRKI